MKYIIWYIIGLLIISLFIVKKLEAVTLPSEALIATTTPVVIKGDKTFEAIGTCESHGDLHAKNPSSTASGEFQFLWGTWNRYGKEYWKKDFYTKNIWSLDNRELAYYVYNKYGTKDWDASKDCWSPLSSM